MLTLRSRYRVSPRHCERSRTYFDADFNVISENNEEARPVQKYRTEPGGSLRLIENLLWLISSNPDQTLLVLHQYQQGNGLKKSGEINIKSILCFEHNII